MSKMFIWRFTPVYTLLNVLRQKQKNLSWEEKERTKEKRRRKEKMSKRARFDRLYMVHPVSGDVAVHNSIFDTQQQLFSASSSSLQSPQTPAVAAANVDRTRPAARTYAAVSGTSAGPVPIFGLRSTITTTKNNNNTNKQYDEGNSVEFVVDPASGAIALNALRNAMVADADSFLSSIAWGDAALDRIAADTSSLTSPDSVSSAAALVVLDVVSKNCGSFSGLLRRICSQLEDAVFQRQSYDVNVAYFDLYRASLSARMLDVRKPQMAVARAFARTNVQLKRLVFQAWRAVVKKNQKQRKLGENRGVRACIRNNRISLRNHFLAWRQYLALRCRVLCSEDAKTQLVRRLARYCKKLKTELQSCQGFCRQLVQDSEVSIERLSSSLEKWNEFKDWFLIENNSNSKLEHGNTQKLIEASSTSKIELPETEILAIEDRSLSELREENENGEQVDENENQKRNEMIIRCADEARRRNDEINVVSHHAEVVVAAATRMEQPPRDSLQLALERQFALVDSTLKNKDAARVSEPPQQKTPEDASIVTSTTLVSHENQNQQHQQQLQRQTGNADIVNVLDWAATRIQCVSASLELKMLPRCTNFTTDFQDGERMLRLLVSLGTSRTLLRRFENERSRFERLRLVCDEFQECVSRVQSQDSVSSILQPSDLTSLKARNVAKSLSLLYRLYSHLPVGALPPPREPKRIQQNAENTNALVASGLSVDVQHNNNENNNTTKEVSTMQLTQWYSELAEDDSDLDAEVVDDEINHNNNAKKSRASNSLAIVTTKQLVEETVNNAQRALDEITAQHTLSTSAAASLSWQQNE